MLIPCGPWAISEPGWIFIVGTICSTLISVVTIIVTKRGLQQSVDANTNLTRSAAKVIIGKADEAATHAKQASEVGVATWQATQDAAQKAAVAAQKAEVVGEQIKELQEDSRLGKSKGHINGDAPTQS